MLIAKEQKLRNLSLQSILKQDSMLPLSFRFRVQTLTRMLLVSWFDGGQQSVRFLNLGVFRYTGGAQTDSWSVDGLSCLQFV